MKCDFSLADSMLVLTAGLLLVIGKAVKPARPRGGQLDKSEVVFTDRFSD